MEIYDYTTFGGKNLIKEYIENLPDALKTEILYTRQLIREKGVEAFAFLITRQVYRKLWEIKISQEVGEMPFVKADLDREKAELDRLIIESEEARIAQKEFQTRIALQKKLVQTRKAENMTQADVAKATGLSQQAVSRIEKGAGATISSLLKYLSGIGYGIELKKL